MNKGSQQVIRYVANKCDVLVLLTFTCLGHHPDDPLVYNVIPNNDLAKKALDSDIAGNYVRAVLARVTFSSKAPKRTAVIFN